MTLTNWLLKSKCMLKHIIFFFKIFFLWKYNVIFFLFKRLAVCMKTKYIFLIFLMFWWKSGILILNLYLYSIKIQTNINQNIVKHLRKNITNFKWFFEFFWDRPDSAQKETRLRSAQNEIGQELTRKRTYLWLDSTQRCGLGWCSSPKQPMY